MFRDEEPFAGASGPAAGGGVEASSRRRNSAAEIEAGGSGGMLGFIPGALLPTDPGEVVQPSRSGRGETVARASSFARATALISHLKKA